METSLSFICERLNQQVGTLERGRAVLDKLPCGSSARGGVLHLLQPQGYFLTVPNVINFITPQNTLLLLPGYYCIRVHMWHSWADHRALLGTALYFTSPKLKRSSSWLASSACEMNPATCLEEYSSGSSLSRAHSLMITEFRTISFALLFKIYYFLFVCCCGGLSTIYLTH